MTYDPINQSELLTQAGPFPASTSFFKGSTPNGVRIATTGGASVSWNEDTGLSVEPGATTDDSIEVYAPSWYVGNDPNLQILITEVYFGKSDGTPTPITDDIEIGVVWNASNLDRGSYIDLATDEVHVGTSTASIGTQHSGFGGTYARIISDLLNDQTTFRLRGEYTADITLNETNVRGSRLLRAESNGGGDQVNLKAARHVFQIDDL